MIHFFIIEFIIYLLLLKILIPSRTIIMHMKFLFFGHIHRKKITDWYIKPLSLSICFYFIIEVFFV